MKNNIYKKLSILLSVFIIIAVSIILFTGVKRVYLFTIMRLMSGSEITKIKAVKPSLYYLADENKNPINNERYQRIKYLKDNLFLAAKNEKMGVINSEGKTVIPFKYDSINFAGNMIVASYIKNVNNIKEALYNDKGKVIFPLRKQKIRVNDSFIIINKGNKYYYYTKNKKFQFKFVSETLPERISDGIYIIKNKGKVFVVDTKGRSIINEDYDELGFNNYRVYKRINGLAAFLIKKHGKYGIISINNELILPIVYDEINNDYFYNDSDAIWVKKDGKWGQVDYKNNIVTDFLYDEIPYIVEKDFVIKKTTDESNIVEEKIFLEEEKNKKIEKDFKKKIEQIQNKRKEIIGDLHVVSVYEGYYKDNSSRMNHGLGTVTVKVEVQNKPVTLLLSAYEPVLWTVKAKKGTNIKKIYITGYYDGDVIVPYKSIPVEKLANYISFDSDRFSKHKLMDEYVNKKPKTFQYKYSSDYFFVDGIEGSDYMDSKYRH